MAIKLGNTYKQECIKTIQWLMEYFPMAFFKHPRDIKPLKLGIFDDIVAFYERLEEPPVSKKKIREALNYYSASPLYLLCQKKGAPRIDLYGNEIDVVTEEQAKYAQTRYQERYHQKPRHAAPKSQINPSKDELPTDNS